ncbi:EXLDI protein [Gordonia sp. CPCC 205515]|uniref:EXLDI protein n=1 Tax=Gordonia sp. CPCC 205515 TaxID=3140791 RepID=UPI003AF33316
MPNKTIYVSDDDVGLLARAQEVSGGNLSGAIIDALRAYVRAADYRDAGYDEVVLREGPNGVRRKRFFGRLLAADVEYDGDTGNPTDRRVYEGRSGKYVLGTHFVDWSTYHERPTKTGNWLKDFTGIPSMRSLFSAELPEWGTYTVEVVDSLEQLKDAVPQRFYDIAAAAQQPDIDDLDV